MDGLGTKAQKGDVKGIKLCPAFRAKGYACMATHGRTIVTLRREYL